MLVLNTSTNKQNKTDIVNLLLDKFSCFFQDDIKEKIYFNYSGSFQIFVSHNDACWTSFQYEHFLSVTHI